MSDWKIRTVKTRNEKIRIRYYWHLEIQMNRKSGNLKWRLHLVRWKRYAHQRSWPTTQCKSQTISLGLERNQLTIDHHKIQCYSIQNYNHSRLCLNCLFIRRSRNILRLHWRCAGKNTTKRPHHCYWRLEREDWKRQLWLGICHG